VTHVLLERIFASERFRVSAAIGYHSAACRGRAQKVGLRQVHC